MTRAEGKAGCVCHQYYRNIRFDNNAIYKYMGYNLKLEFDRESKGMSRRL